MRTYAINEIFLSLQGEGIRAGTLNFFIRFAKCNLKCAMAESRLSPGGFDCDTEFESFTKLSSQSILDMMSTLDTQDKCRNIIFTGGEPTLQLDTELIEFFKAKGYYLAIETNGTKEVLPCIDWITLSPKVAEHALKQLTANEVKYVRGYSQALPQTRVKADHYLISPAFAGQEMTSKTLEWCIGLIKTNPTWRLSVQLHKLWNVQ